MKTLMRAVLVALLLATFAAGGASAGSEYAIDAVHSSVQFKVRHLISNFVGKFDQFEGTIVLDTANISKSSVEVTVDVQSIDTDNTDRDAHLRAPDFFNADSLYPTATFKSTSVSGQPGSFQVTGDLTMHGVTKSVTLDCEFFGEMDAGERMGVRAGFSGNAKIKRLEFGVGQGFMSGNSVMIGDDVELMLQIEAVKK